MAKEYISKQDIERWAQANALANTFGKPELLYDLIDATLYEVVKQLTNGQVRLKDYFKKTDAEVVLEASDTPGILATDIHADGRHVDLLCVPGHVSGGQVSGTPLLQMDGQAVFKLAVGVLEECARTVLAKAGKTEADIDWLVPHQANIRIMQSTARKLKLPMDKVVVSVDQHGNTSAASIPLALDGAVRSGQIQPGQTVLLEGVGGGFAWGAVLLTL